VISVLVVIVVVAFLVALIWLLAVAFIPVILLMFVLLAGSFCVHACKYYSGAVESSPYHRSAPAKNHARGNGREI
jgi:fatty acid desaturase